MLKREQRGKLDLIGLLVTGVDQILRQDQIRWKSAQLENTVLVQLQYVIAFLTHFVRCYLCELCRKSVGFFKRQSDKHKALKTGWLGLVQCSCPLKCGIEETAYESFFSLSLLSWQDCAGAGRLSLSLSVRSLDVTTETGGGCRDR